MKKWVIFVFLFFLNYLIFSQEVIEGIVYYRQECTPNHQLPDSLKTVEVTQSLSNPAYLLFGKNACVYMYGSKKLPNTNFKFDDTGKVLYKNLEKKEMIYKDFIPGIGMTTIEENNEYFPKFNWSITTESRKLGSFTCYKATCYFRGRHWEAWFCPDIPVKMGPWKFYGLPGLILEVYDKNKEINYLFEGVEIPAKNTLLLQDIGLQIKPYYGKISASWQDYKERYKSILEKDAEEYLKRKQAEFAQRGQVYPISNMKPLPAISVEPIIELEFEH